jgi:hypothetical protein
LRSLLLILFANLYNPFTYYLAFITGIFFVGSVFERVRYKKLENADPGPDWRETDERFIDPASGERRYVAKGKPGNQSR